MNTDTILTLFTNNPDLAARADSAGINRIGLDLEYIGKFKRQGHLKSWVSDHTKHQIPHIRNSLKQADLFVRTNPIHNRLDEEIEHYLEQGVKVLMLPMFTSPQDAETFIRIIDGRCTTSLLVETPAAMQNLSDIVKVAGIDEIHVGLNDLHLGLGLPSHFILLGMNLMEQIAATVHAADIPLGIGGIGRYNDERLPVPSDLIYARLARLGATRSLVSRVFMTPDYHTLDLPREVMTARKRILEWRLATDRDSEAARHELMELARGLSAQKV